MPRKRRSSSPFELYDDELDDDASSQGSHNANMPLQRNAANARERARMRVLSSAFGRLKTKLPNIPPDTKLSKLDTLRLATMYIRQLKAAVEGNSSAIGGGSSSCGSNNSMEHFDAANLMAEHLQQHGMNWPFGFHNAQNNAKHVLFSTHTNSPIDWSSHTQHPFAKHTQYEPATFHEQEQQQQHNQQSPHQQQQHQPQQWYSTAIHNYDLSQQQLTNCSYINKQQQQQQQQLQHNTHYDRIHQCSNVSAAPQLQETHSHLQSIAQTTMQS